MFGMLDDEQLAIRETIERFAQARIAPHAADWDATSSFPRDVLEELARLDLMGMTIPEYFGGSALSRLHAAIVYTTLAEADLSTAVWLSVHNMAASIIARAGSDELKQQWLPAMARGAALGAFSLSEADAGSDPSALRTTAQRAGDQYVLNGSKMWVTSGSVAQVFVIMARTGPKAISAFIVPSDAPGLRVGKIVEKMGLHSSPTTELILEDCRIPATHLLGFEGDGLKIALGALEGGRVNIAAAATGLGQAAVTVATRYARERKQFDRTIGEFQAIQCMLADMVTAVDAARLLTYRAADLLDHALGATREAAMAKCFATDMAMRVTTDAVQILGGAGYTKDWPVERYMRDAKATQIFEGTNQIQRIIIARSVLRDNAR